MSFSRLPYDKCAYSQKIKRSVTPGDYRLYSGFGENCKKCLPLNAPINSNNGASSVRPLDSNNFGVVVNAESHLTNRNIPHSECNENSTDSKHKEMKVHHKPLCAKAVATVDTRFTHPVDTYRGMSLTNFHMTPHLHVNPQNNVQCDSHREGFHTRVWVKDNYQIPKQTKWDDGSSLPPKPKEAPKQPKCNVKCTN